MKTRWDSLPHECGAAVVTGDMGVSLRVAHARAGDVAYETVGCREMHYDCEAGTFWHGTRAVVRVVRLLDGCRYVVLAYGDGGKCELVCRIVARRLERPGRTVVVVASGAAAGMPTASFPSRAAGKIGAAGRKTVAGVLDAAIRHAAHLSVKEATL